MGIERVSEGGSRYIQRERLIPKREDRFCFSWASAGGLAKVMKGKRRPRGWQGGLRWWWKGLVVCCFGECEDLHTEALVVVPVSEF